MYNKTMAESFDIERKISEIEAELANLDHHRDQLLDELTQLRRQLLQKDSPAQLPLHLQGIAIHIQSSQEGKIRLFRSLFKGREDVFPRRFENPKPESQATPLSVVMNGKQVSVRSPRSPARNAIFARLFK